MIRIGKKDILVNRLRMKGSPISSGIQLRKENNGKDMKTNINQTEVEDTYSVPG